MEGEGDEGEKERASLLVLELRPVMSREKEDERKLQIGGGEKDAGGMKKRK